MKKRASKVHNLRPTILGTGLVALDVVVSVHSEGAPRCYAGGTCGNVLAILSYLGWDACPVSRLAPGPTADRLLADLRAWKVSTKFITLEEGGSTPIIVQRISLTATGDPRHSFSWRCPGCGAHYPGYKPVLGSATEDLASSLPRPQVFFFDRVSRGALNLAKVSAERGGLIVFEPSGVGDPRLFREAWSLAHVVKYSHERLRDIADLELKQSEREGVLLEIETLGADGLRFRSRLPKLRAAGWRPFDAIKPHVLKDAAGAGDWCTAGILNRLARGGITGFRKTTSQKLHDAIQFGQALAAWNCGYEGARGGMYHVNRRIFKKQVEAILTGAETVPPVVTTLDNSIVEFLKCLCPACGKADFAACRSVRRSGPHCRS